MTENFYSTSQVCTHQKKLFLCTTFLQVYEQEKKHFWLSWCKLIENFLG